MFVKSWSPGRVAIYLRVSSDEQREQQTIEAQRRQVRLFCQRHELNVVAEFEDDGVSGESEITARPGGAALIRAAGRREFDTLYVAAVDRLGRAAYYVLHAEHLLSHSAIKLQSVTEPFDPTEVTGKLLLALLAGKAGADKQTIYDRTENGKAMSLTVDDRYLGGVVPFGYMILWEGQRKKYVVCSETIPHHEDWSPALLISYCFRRSGEGATDAVISNELEGFGLPTCWIPGDRRYDTPVYTGWTMHRVRDLLSNPFYAGRQLWGKKQARRTAPLERRVPAIVSWEEYEASAATRKRNRTMADRNATRFNLLRGVIRCAHCGATYVGSTGYNSLRSCYVYQCYRNRNLGKGYAYCRSKWLDALRIEAQVRSDIEGFLRRPEEFLDELRGNIGATAAEAETHIAAADAYDRERQALDKQELEFYRLRAQGVIGSDDKLKLLLTELQQRAVTLGRLVDEEREKATAAVRADLELNAAAAILWEMHSRVEEGFTEAEWLQLVRRFVVGVTVTTHGEGRRRATQVDVTYRVGSSAMVTTDRAYIWGATAPLAMAA